MRNYFEKFFNNLWYKALDKKYYKIILYLLIPLSWLFELLIKIRYLYYKFYKPYTFPVPIIIVGNITVGGTGKTPVIIALVKLLQQQGLRPGVITRGYHSLSKNLILLNNKNYNNTALYGDEPVLLAKNANIPIAIGKDRLKAVKKLLTETNINIILADDGLQHYRLPRTLEICLIDGKRKFGNQYLLPAGPCREPISRLKICDFVLYKNLDFNLIPIKFINLATAQEYDLDYFLYHKLNNIIAMCGIGNPDGFFDLLTKLKINYNKCIFPDHYNYKSKDFRIFKNNIIIVTEKDAVKINNIKTLNQQNIYYLKIIAIFNKKFIANFLILLQ